MLRADHCRFEPEPRRGRWSFAVGAVLCAGLVGGLVSPAWAAEPPGDVGEVQLGSFALGDALEASIGELDGAFGFTVTAGGLQLGWDSRAAGTDAVRLGDGWSFGLAKVRVTGGVWVHTASGGAYQMSASSSSGLAGYPGTDVVFAEAEPGALVPARADGSAAETPYAFVLHELGGVSTYFDAAGNPVRSSVREGDSAEGRVLTRADYVPTAIGDLAAETVTVAPDTPDAIATTRQFEYSEVGELTAIVTDGERRTQEFDAEGNQTASVTGDRYEYDAAGRLVAQTTPEGVRVETSYWTDGSRKELATATGTTRYYWDGDRLINEAHASAASTGMASYLIGANRQARTIRADGARSTTSYYGTDRHGNVTDLTDATGRVTTSYAYSDYGVAAASGEEPGTLPEGIGELDYNPFQYAGEYTFRDGTQPLGPRTYNPMQARFLTMDDAPLANLYAFGDLNPVTNIDPSGRAAQLDWSHLGPLIAGFVAAAFGAAMFVWSGGVSLGALGVVSGLVAGGDATLAGFEVARGFGEVQWSDPYAMEIASWSFFAASVVLGFGGGFAKLAKRGGKPVAKPEPEPAGPEDVAGADLNQRKSIDGDSPLNETTTEPPTVDRNADLESFNATHSEILRRQEHLEDVSSTRFRGMSGQMLDTKLVMHLDSAAQNLEHAQRVTDRYSNFDFFELGGKGLAEAVRVDDKLVKYQTDALFHLEKAQKRLEKVINRRVTEGGTEDQYEQLDLSDISEAVTSLRNALTPGKRFEPKRFIGEDY
ncbi:RHS repeat domain-containing protein [Agromyces aerolatus]|uniref:RHS repeat domain-containing protein n=1 Tax=Agromyces sp. LY-1074 TaxID=3074080 RepID=UPI002856F4A1|nr:MULTISPECIES: RHS repeat-associated core domain-containing protein [unclassified Agromyces]MDR5698219.1 RHS repeat-associated core domain-containing protein [Agromyces sp. LY-1074]MDR5704513.1 RHS repeat-associated core domain-containing protein [Agromyces sp. LY-1358]